MVMMIGNGTIGARCGSNRLIVARIADRQALRARVELRVYLVKPTEELNGLHLVQLQVPRAVGWCRFWLERWDDDEPFDQMLMALFGEEILDRCETLPLDDLMGHVKAEKLGVWRV